MYRIVLCVSFVVYKLNQGPGSRRMKARKKWDKTKRTEHQKRSNDERMIFYSAKL